MTSNDSLLGETRSTSEVVGVALLVGIVIIGVLVILFAGLSQLGDSQDEIEISQAEQALTEFDGEAIRVATGSTSSQRISLGLQGNSGTLDVEPESGTITVEYFDALTEKNRTEVLHTSIGTVVYENGQTTVGYQGGGVWRSDGDSSVMVSPPEISFEGNTLTMPVIETHRGGSVHSDVEITASGVSEQAFPDRKAEGHNLTNRVNDGIIEITIQSRYYQAWARFFEKETTTFVDTIDAEEKVIVTFFGSQYNFSPDAGIIATSGPGTLRVEGSGSYIDSYNSFEGTYDEAKSKNGTVKSAGNIDMFGGSLIEGDAESNNQILLDGGSEITGDACADTVETSGDSTVQGDTDCESNVPVLPPLDLLVEQKVEELSSPDNDNGATKYIEDERLNLDEAGTPELGPGGYYLEEIEFKSGETLILNATEGDITLVVENYVTLDEGNIEVKGDNDDGTVQVFVAAEESSGETVQGTGGEPADHFYINRDSQITVKNDHSPRFQVIAPRHFTGGIRSSHNVNAQVTGVILAPTRGEGPSQFIVRDSELFGAVVTGNLSAENNAEVHFDKATTDLDIPFGSGASLLDYLYVMRHKIEVRGS